MKNLPKKKKFNVLDVFALVLLVALIAGAAWRFYSPSANVTSGAKKIEYTLKVNGVRPFTAQYYQPGLKCFDKNTGDAIGTIKSTRVEKFYTLQATRTGQLYKALRPNAVVIYVTIEAEGRETPDAVYASATYKLKVGSEVHLVTKYNDVVSTVEAIGDNSIITFGPEYEGPFDR